MLDSLIKNRLDLLEPAYRSAILSDLPSTIGSSFAEYYDLDEDKTDALTNAVVLLLLFLLNEQQFIEFVTLECGISRAESQSLYHGIVLALPEPIRADFEETKNVLDTNTPRSDASLLQAEITATEEALTALPTFRTMAPIIPTEETVYTSTQAAILHEGRVNPSPTSAQTSPSASHPPSSPRWDTEA